ncbi:MAG: hypothetical protein WCI62_02505 [Erysipelotrichaceae bacterium]
MIDTLKQIQDERNGSKTCLFNGYLEDYVNSMEEDHSLKPLFIEILALNQDFRILVNYHFNLQVDLISNQIIRYKDVTKIPANHFNCPYLLYGLDANEETIGIIIDNLSSYHILKGIYYVLTETGALLEPMKNKIIVLHANKNPISTIDKCVKDNTHIKYGGVQRSIDATVYQNLDNLKTQIIQEANKLQEDFRISIANHTHKADEIYKVVIQWFLLKKVLYVQTMMNRNFLEKQCANDVKVQRHHAKLNADEVSFIAYSELWRL